jgi:hypothetical protein
MCQTPDRSHTLSAARLAGYQAPPHCPPPCGATEPGPSSISPSTWHPRAPPLHFIADASRALVLFFLRPSVASTHPHLHHPNLLRQGAAECYHLLPPHGEHPLQAPLSSDRDNLIVPLPPCSCRAPSGPPPSSSAASSIKRHHTEPPSPSQRRATTMVGPRYRLLTQRLDSAPLVLTAPIEPPPGQLTDHRRARHRAGRDRGDHAPMCVPARPSVRLSGCLGHSPLGHPASRATITGCWPPER